MRLIPIVCLLSAAGGAHAGDLRVTIEDIRGAEGALRVEVLGDELAFAGEAPATLSAILPAREGRVSFATDALAPGDYGVRVMHDIDGDGELASNLLGMPTEPWGVSNNAAGSFGPPKWRDVKFELDEDGETLVIRLNH